MSFTSIEFVNESKSEKKPLSTKRMLECVKEEAFFALMIEFGINLVAH